MKEHTLAISIYTDFSKKLFNHVFLNKTGSFSGVPPMIDPSEHFLKQAMRDDQQSLENLYATISKMLQQIGSGNPWKQLIESFALAWVHAVIAWSLDEGSFTDEIETKSMIYRLEIHNIAKGLDYWKEVELFTKDKTNYHALVLPPIEKGGNEKNIASTKRYLPYQFDKIFAE